MKQGKPGIKAFREAFQTLLRMHSMEKGPADPGFVDHKSARNVGPCTLAPVTAITHFRYHNSSGVALYHHAGTPKDYHWVCMSLQKHRMIHASSSRRPHDQHCTYSQRTRQLLALFYQA
jgi:hypothetical protein